MRVAWLGSALLVLAACATSAPPAAVFCAPPASARQVSELYFGRGIPGGGEVSDSDWRGFVDEVVTPRFPEGITVLDADGQYRMSDGSIVRERSKVLILLPADPSAEARLAEVIEAYKRRFHQESVLRRDGVSCISFP